ncbi:MAG: hypothetical protein ACTH2U_12135 [Brevibacterium sp.]
MNSAGGAYRPRSVRFLNRVAVGDWTMKLYGISIAGSEVPEALTTAAVRAAKEALPSPVKGDRTSGIGFITAHAAPSRSYVLISWWAEHNELHQLILSAPPGRAGELAPHPTSAIGCVWELGVTDFERRAWITDILRPGEPHLSAYLEREYDEIF